MKKFYLVGLLLVGLLFAGFSKSQAYAEESETTSSGGSVKMYRLYNLSSGEHFYTGSEAERGNLASLGWKYEGIGWIAPTAGDPVYRLYNANAGDHHYTLSEAEKNNLIQAGWRYEGISWYSDTTKRVPLYRAYNPNAKAGSHNYTTNGSEQNHLTSNGWQDEGIAWYALEAAPQTSNPPSGNTTNAVYSKLATPYMFENFGKNNWQSRNGTKITTIVIHHAAILDFDEMPSIWGQDGRSASAHYGIGQDGEIRAYVGEEKAAWHCGNGNNYTIGIECINTSLAPDWKVSDATVDALVGLIKEIQSRRGKLEIVGHRDIPGNTTTTICPGPSLYPRLQEIRDRVNGVN